MGWDGMRDIKDKRIQGKGVSCQRNESEERNQRRDVFDLSHAFLLFRRQSILYLLIFHPSSCSSHERRKEAGEYMLMKSQTRLDTWCITSDQKLSLAGQKATFTRNGMNDDHSLPFYWTLHLTCLLFPKETFLSSSCLYFFLFKEFHSWKEISLSKQEE